MGEGYKPSACKKQMYGTDAGLEKPPSLYLRMRFSAGWVIKIQVTGNSEKSLFPYFLVYFSFLSSGFLSTSFKSTLIEKSFYGFIEGINLHKVYSWTAP